MWIMVGGPYTSGARSDQERQRNLDVLNHAALALFEKGHTPIIGVNLALPVIDLAGQNRFQEIMMPLSLELASRCDAFLRVAGASKGADEERDQFIARGLPVFHSLDEVPEV